MNQVGIAILSYQRLDRLKQCIDSLLQNTETPFDLYIVDNGSDKATVAYLKELNHQGIANVGLNDRNAGWTVAKNQSMAMIRGYEIQVLMENDVMCRSLVPGKDWLQLHVDALDALGVPVLHGRHSLRDCFGPMHDPVDEEYCVKVLRAGYPVRLHVDMISRMLIFRREVAERVGGFNWEMAMPWGAFVDIEWSDRVLRCYEEETGLVFGVSLDESVFEFREILGSEYPDVNRVKQLSRSVHAPIFRDRRRRIWDDVKPDLFIPLKGISGG